MPTDKAVPRRKAAIYLRISLDREMDGFAIDRQREQCEALAAYRQWEVVEIYVDQSKSATDRTKIRPAYDQMVADYKAGAFDAIICYDLDRLTCQPRQLEDWIDASELRGLALVTANGDADLSTDGGRMSARIKAAVARAEMERKSARQSAAQLQRAKQGRAPKGMRPFGYAVNGDVIPDEAEAVRAIYRLFTRAEHPESLRSLARALSGTQPLPGISPRPKHSHVVSVERAQRRIAEGKEPRPVAPDGDWSPSTIIGILRNPRYAQISTYTPKTAQPDGGRRRTWRAQILRDDAGEPIRGQWEAIVDDETWWRAQSILDDTERATNTSGSTKRKHLGSGLYRCGVCDAKVTGAPRGYRCAKHVQRDDQGNVTVTGLMRSGAEVDAFVLKVIAKRLKMPDALRMETVADSTLTSSGINAAISEQRARILRAQHDYDEEIIEGRDLKRIRDAAEAHIAQLESERLMRGQTTGLSPVLGADDPSQAFLDASLEVQRQVIDVLATVTLLPHPRGKKTFNPDTVVIEWR
ncbi:recombinase family protein [Corynebacterium sp. P7202]|uniref:Recombinase family protein n=1 Tax=Corynebacterium pygosceleis TaxID=2800406 RepID=A0A9Q4GK21_9CORY|nr:recombinase family protein [Corynebacterium pygosceleis]MCK7638023.1 recombinase family protein [Corynebacterium pygosceleis]MCX7468739.1 recombinase family protein [Corynebacterium pygosceleis]